MSSAWINERVITVIIAVVDANEGDALQLGHGQDLAPAGKILCSLFLHTVQFRL